MNSKHTKQGRRASRRRYANDPTGAKARRWRKMPASERRTVALIVSVGLPWLSALYT